MTVSTMIPEPAVRPPRKRFFGMGLGHPDEGRAEAWVRLLGLSEQVQVCLHRMSGPVPHVVLSLAVPYGTAVELPAVAAGSAGAAVEAAAAHAAGRSGRAIVFRGARAVTGRMSVADVLARSEIGRVLTPGGVADDGEVLDAGAGVTPHWADSVLTLMVVRHSDGLLRQEPRSSTM